MTNTLFEMIKYHKQNYPANIPLRIEEVAAHFDIAQIDSNLMYSLHTEYSYGKRKFDSKIISLFPELIAAKKDGVPQLWKSAKWAQEFAHFIILLCKNQSKPQIIEIHPPFSDYTTLDEFVDIYSVFEQIILSSFKNVTILIENRCGSIYSGGKFVFSKIEDFFKLKSLIKEKRLKIAFDVQQLFTSHSVSPSNINLVCELLCEMTNIKNYIGGVHLWGKKKSNSGRLIAHCGNLTDYFEENQNSKEKFLNQFFYTFNDGIVRKMVLEVNSGNEDLLSITNDLLSRGIQFV